MSEFAVQTTDVTRIYGNETVPVYALRGISLSVEVGEFVSIVGPSGIGQINALARNRWPRTTDGRRNYCGRHEAWDMF